MQNWPTFTSEYAPLKCAQSFVSYRFANRCLFTDQADAEAAAHRAWQATDAQLNDIRAQRHHVTRQKALNGQNVEMPVAAPELLALYMKVNKYRYHRGPNRVGWFSPTSGPKELRNVAAALGLPVPRPNQESLAA